MMAMQIFVQLSLYLMEVWFRSLLYFGITNRKHSRVLANRFRFCECAIDLNDSGS